MGLQSEGDTVYSEGERSPVDSLRSYGPEFSQRKGSEGEVLTCHNSA